MTGAQDAAFEPPFTPARGPACWLRPALPDAEHHAALTPARGPQCWSPLDRLASQAALKPTRSRAATSTKLRRPKRSRHPTGRRTYRQQLGQDAEDAAAKFLWDQGLEILLRNFRCRFGELDLVAKHGNALVIAEVRMRSSGRFGGAAASVNYRKQQRIIRAASMLLLKRRDLAGLRVRFDVICVDPWQGNTRPTWLQHAFST